MTTVSTGAEARDEGVEAVLAAATAVHRAGGLESMREALDAFIDAEEPFTADDVRHLADNPQLHHPNVLSALFSQAARQGRIRPIGDPIRTARRTRHGGLVRRWQAVPKPYPSGGAA